MTILNRLSACRQPNELQAFLNETITPHIGCFFGGRRFVLLGESGSLSLNDIVKQFKAIHQNSPRNKDILKIEKDISKKIYKLDSEANILLEKKHKKNYFVFLITAIRSFIAKFIFRDKILGSIRREIEFELGSIREKKIQERNRFYSLSISEIVDELYNQNTNEKQKEKLKGCLSEKLSKVSNNNDIKEIKKAFALLNDQENFIALVKDVERFCDLVTLAICELFESLQWPTEDLKKQYLPEILRKSIFDIGNNTITYKAEMVKGSLIIQIIIDPRGIFGRRNFITKPINTPPSLAKAVALACISIGEKVLQQNEKHPQANIPLPIKLEIKVSTFFECVVPRSMVEPMIPYLLSNPHFSIIFDGEELVPHQKSFDNAE